MTRSFRSLRWHRHAWCAAALCLLSLCIVPARASGASAEAEFKSALQHYDAGDYAAALPLFKKALATTHSPNARLYIARSLRRLGRLAEAYDEMSKTAEDATRSAKSEPRYKRTRDAAKQELAELAKLVGHVVINVENLSPDVKVQLNGRDVPADRLGAPIAVMPGAIVVTASGAGTNPVTSRVSVDAGSTAAVALVLSKAPPGETSPPPPPAASHTAPPPPLPPSHSSAVRTAGFVVAGIGVAGFATFAVAGLMANSKFNSVKNACHDTRCTDPSYADQIDKGKTLDRIATTGLIVGAVGIVAGGTMILLGKPGGREGVALDVSPGGARVGYSGSF